MRNLPAYGLSRLRGVTLAALVLCTGCSFGGLDGTFTPKADAVDTGTDTADDTGDGRDSTGNGIPRDMEFPAEVTCLGAEDCYPGEVCEDFRCRPTVMDCNINRDCRDAPECHKEEGECRDGTCHYTPSLPGDACRNPDLCTENSRCDEDLECVVGESVCVLPEPDCDRDTLRVAAAVKPCVDGEEPCSFHWVGAPCEGCDIEACGCEIECPPMGGGCSVGACFGTGCVYRDVENGSPCQGGNCLDGQCLQCVTADDCEVTEPCQKAECLGSSCAFRVADDGDVCSTEELEGTCRDGTCVECVTDDDCDWEFKPFCDGVHCRECRTPADCEGDAKACETGHCLYCATAADCDDGDPCTFDYCAAQVAHCRHPLYEDCSE